MSKEAMKLALEALINSVDLVSNEAREAESLYGNYPSRLARIQGLVALEVAHQAAIKALEEALAKEEQDWSLLEATQESLREHMARIKELEAQLAKQEQGEPDEFLLRGILASELKFWHRLNSEESQNLIDFVKNMGAKQEQKRPQNCGTSYCSCIECVMEQEQGEPVAWLHWLHGPVRLFLNKDEAMMELDRLNREYPVDEDARQMRPLYTTPPKQEQGEPVAYLKFWAAQRITQDGDVDADDGYEVCRKGEVGVDGIEAFPVYTTPQQRKPLTQEQIDSIPLKNLNKYNTTVAKKYLVRTVEAMHNIKE